MESSPEPMSGTAKFWWGLCIVVLVACAGGTAGLQISLFSIDRLFLRVLSTTGTAAQQAQARKLIAVLRLNHWTLVALILLNASFMMTLPIVLEHLFDPLTALIVSSTAVLFVGEVLPLALFVRFAVPVCAALSPVIWFAIVVSAPVSYPVGLLLDRILGVHSEEPLDREEFAALIAAPLTEEGGGETAPPGAMLSVNATALSAEGTDAAAGASEAPGSAAAAAEQFRLQEFEVKMLQGAMTLSADTIREHLRVTTEDAFMLSADEALDRDTITRVLSSGFSRVPVFLGADRTHVIGALIVNTLVRLSYRNPQPPPLVGTYPLRELVRLSEDASMHDAYLAFRSGRSNMAAVYSAQGVMVGLLTLADVLATLYHANPERAVTHLSSTKLRRRERLVELVEGVKVLNAAKGVRPLALQSPHNVNVQTSVENVVQSTAASSSPPSPQPQP